VNRSKSGPSSGACHPGRDLAKNRAVQHLSSLITPIRLVCTLSTRSRSRAVSIGYVGRRRAHHRNIMRSGIPGSSRGSRSKEACDGHETLAGKLQTLSQRRKPVPHKARRHNQTETRPNFRWRWGGLHGWIGRRVDRGDHLLKGPVTHKGGPLRITSARKQQLKTHGSMQRHLWLGRKRGVPRGFDFYPGGSLLPCRLGWPPSNPQPSLRARSSPPHPAARASRGPTGVNEPQFPTFPAKRGSATSPGLKIGSSQAF